MRKSLYLPIATLFIAPLCMGTQCNKVRIEFKYNFLEKINLFPVKKSYNIGDTIWLQYSNSNKQLYDSRTKNYIPTDTVSIGFQTALNSLYNAPVNPSDGFCDFITANGFNTGTNPGIYGSAFINRFGCNSNNSYDFKVGVVPKHIGIYSLDLTGVASTVSACSNRISWFPLSTIAYNFNVVDCNKDVYLSIPPQSRGESIKGYTESIIDNKQMFIVKVE